MDWATRRGMLIGRAPVFAPADEGAGAAQAGGEGDGAPADGGEGGGEEGEGAAASSILDFATKTSGEQQQEGDAWQLPEGVDLPDHLLGQNAEETLAKVAKAYAGARRDISKGKSSTSMQGDVPETFEGYTFEAESDDDAIAAELNSEASKPYVDAFRKAAHKAGIPAAAFQQLMRDGMAGIGESGIPLGVSNEQAQQISGEAEMESLVKEVGQKEASTMINTISTYAQKLQARGVLSDEADAAEFAQMVGTARAARIFHRILTGEMGERPIPVADGADGSVTSQEAYAAHARASAMPQGAERDQALSEANRLMQKAFGTSPTQTGSLRSSVL